MSAGCSHCPDEVRDTDLRRVLWAVLAVNATMFVVEGTSGLLSSSMALQADSVDFLGDSLTYAVSLMVIARPIAWRAGAGIGKGLAMGAFGAAVFLATMLRAFEPGAPAAATMGVVGLLALMANVGCAAALFRYRGRDSNMRSVWLCSRNDGINNLAVLVAAGAVFVTASRWPDLLVGFGLALLALTTAWQIIRQATGELRQAPPG